MDNDLYRRLLGNEFNKDKGFPSTRFSKKRLSSGMPNLDFNVKRRRAALHLTCIEKDKSVACGCNSHCNENFTAEDILVWRQKIHVLPEGPKRMTALISIIRECAMTYQHTKTQTFKVNDKTVCRYAFINLILRVSPATFTRGKAALIKGLTYMDEKVHNIRVQGAKGAVCKGFLEAYFNITCDHDPTCQRYRMPAGITRMDLYNLYQTVHKDERLNQSQFYQVMSSNFPHVSFSKSQKCTKCTDCSNFKELIDKEKNLEKRKDLMAIRDLHLQQQQNERESYYVRRAQAEMRPHHILSLIIDGMDQRKTDLPHYIAWNSPNGAGSRKLRTHIMGSIVHGRNKYFFVDYNQYPHNTNMSLTILLNILINEAKDQRLPPVLYIQLDNTVRENKNKYFLGFLGYLVKRKFVKEVWLSFLIVGHTHEDIDQAFSKISHKLNEESVITRSSLLDVIKRSHKDQNAQATNLNAVWNISEWLGDSICQVHNVTFPHLYRIFSDQTGHVTVQFKELSTDLTWRPAWDEPPLEIFKLDERSQQIIPEGQPPLVEPKMDPDDWLEVKRSMEKDFKLAVVSEVDEVEWRDFLENPFQESEVAICPLHLLQTYQEVESYSTLSEKEKNLILNYKKKAQTKQVYTTQQASGGHRAERADRRKYNIGKYVLYLADETVIQIGQVMEVATTEVTLEIYSTKQFKVSLTSIKHLRTSIFNILPGDFELPSSRRLPIAIMRLIKERSFMLK